MGIQRYVFFSIHNCDRHPEVPLMLIKSCTEKYLETSGLNFTTFRMCGFMQVSTPTHVMSGDRGLHSNSTQKRLQASCSYCVSAELLSAHASG